MDRGKHAASMEVVRNKRASKGSVAVTRSNVKFRRRPNLIHQGCKSIAAGRKCRIIPCNCSGLGRAARVKEDDADQDTESLPAAAPGGPAVGVLGSSGSWNLGKRFVKEKSRLELSKRFTDSPWYVEEVINARMANFLWVIANVFQHKNPKGA